MEVLYDEKYITTKIKPYEYEIKTDFCNDVLPPWKTCLVYLKKCLTYLIILIYFYGSDKGFYPQWLQA